MKPLSIFIGYDPREHAAYEVAWQSIIRRSTSPVLITPLYLQHLTHICNRFVQRTQDDKLWCPISEAAMSTEFAISRFCVPFIQEDGWALFTDCDIVCLSDISELFAEADERYAVQVVKHDHRPEELVKLDGQVQTIYPRKNWSSVVLWNCSHAAHRRLTRARLNMWPGRDLHAFKWLDDSEIGDLNPQWNRLVGTRDVRPPYWQAERIDENASIAGSGREGVPYYSEWGIYHFTLGGPWLKDWKGGPLDDIWLAEREGKQLEAFA